MEVHHHPQLKHEHKPWKEYLLEGFMIFIAVFMGFVAENIREGITDHNKEKEYIVSMIEDAQRDTLNYQAAINLNSIRSAAIDSLTQLCYSFNGTQANVPNIYRFYRAGIRHPDFVNPVERTITQLNTGGMRLIKNKAAADSIIAYNDYSKKLFDQQAYYELYQNKSVDVALKLFNWKYLHTKEPKPDYSDAKLQVNDKNMVVELANHSVIYNGVVSFYIRRLREGKQHAINLIKTLKAQYKITDE